MSASDFAVVRRFPESRVNCRALSISAKIELKHRETVLLQFRRERGPLTPDCPAAVAAQVMKHQYARRFHALIAGIISALQLDFIDGFETDFFRLVLR